MKIRHSRLKKQLTNFEAAVRLTSKGRLPTWHRQAIAYFTSLKPLEGPMPDRTFRLAYFKHFRRPPTVSAPAHFAFSIAFDQNVCAHVFELDRLSPACQLLAYRLTIACQPLDSPKANATACPSQRPNHHLQTENFDKANSCACGLR
jgi:hypothetical protein